MKEVEELEFCFKGKRTYIHGTDIYNKIVEILQNAKIDGNLDLSFHGVAKNNIFISDNKPKDDKLLKFACKYFNNNGEKKICYGIENNNKVECRYKYSEENICNLSNINMEEKSVFLDKNTQFTFIENVVALNKYLLENLFIDVKGKWYFTRLQINKIQQNEDYPLKLVLKANFNFKLTKTEIFITDESIGYIYFSLV